MAWIWGLGHRRLLRPHLEESRLRPLGAHPPRFRLQMVDHGARNQIRIGRRISPAAAAPVVIARPKAHTSAPVRVVFQAVLGGLQTDFFPSLRLSRPLTMMMLYFCVACMAMLGWAVRSGTHTTLAGALDFAAIGCLTLTWLAVLCILVREIRAVPLCECIAMGRSAWSGGLGRNCEVLAAKPLDPDRAHLHRRGRRDARQCGFSRGDSVARIRTAGQALASAPLLRSGRRRRAPRRRSHPR